MYRRLAFIILATVMFLLTMSSALAEMQWVLFYNETFEDNDISEYTSIDGTFQVLGSGCYDGTYCLHEDSGVSAGDYFLYINNDTFAMDNSKNYSMRVWGRQESGDSAYGGTGYFIQDTSHWYSAGFSSSSSSDARATIWYDNGAGSVFAANTDEGGTSSAYKDVWVYIETFHYTNDSTQIYVYTAANKSTLLVQVGFTQIAGFTTGHMGFYSLRGFDWDNAELYIWKEPPAAGEPTPIEEADWISPSNTPQANNTSPFLLNWTASTDDESESNLTYRLYINNLLNQTTNDTHYNWAVDEGTYILRVDVSEWTNLTRWITGDNMTFTYDTTNPLITLNQNNFYLDDNTSFFTTAQASALLFNYTITDNHDVYAIEVNISCTDGFTFYYNDTSLSGTSVVWNYTTNLSTAHGNCTVIATSWDSHTDEKIKDYKIKEEKDKITYDDKVSIKSDETFYMWTWKEKDRYSWSIIYDYYAKKEKKMTITGTDTLEYLPNSEFPGHFVDWEEKKWIDLDCYEFINYTLEEGNKINIKKVKKNKQGEYEVTFDTEASGITCHSIGGLNSYVKTNHFIINDVPVIIEVQALSITNTSLNPVEGWANSTDADNDTLTYFWQFYKNGTLQISGNTSGLAANLLLQVANTTTTTLTAGDNWTFRTRAFDGWNYTNWMNSTGLYIESVTLSVCGGEFIYPILNITYKNTQTGAAINASNAYALILDDGIIELPVTGSFASNTTHSFCTTINPAHATYSWNLWGTFNIQSSPLLPKTVSIAELSPMSISNDPTKEQEYQLIDGTNSSTVVITWTTDSYAIVDGTLRIYKCESDGTRTIMDETPITGGTSTANLNLYFTQYSYEVIIGSIAYQGSSYYTCHAENSESPSYQIIVDDVDTSEAIGLYFATCIMNKTNNNTAKMTWTANPSSEDPLLGCFRAKRLTASGWTLIYENCTSALNGEIERTIPLGGNSYIVEGTLTQGSLSAQCTPTLDFHALTPAQSGFGNAILMGIVLFLMVLSLVFEHSFMKVIAVITGIVGVWFIGLTAIGWITLMGLISYLLIIFIVSRGKKT